MSAIWSSSYGKFAVVLLLLALPAAFLVTQRTSVDAMPCPCNVFGNPTGQNNFDDGTDLELGFKFKSDIDGYISGVRFYKQGPMSGTHTGTLWTSGGSVMASATFTETASGWQEVSFSSPVSITAGTTYVASVSIPDGKYVATQNYFTSEITNFPLRAPSSGSSGGNGVFALNAGDFPISSSSASNYWVDVVYRGNLGVTPPAVSATVPTDDATDVNPGETVSATFDDKMDPSTLTTSTFSVRDSEGNSIPGTVAYSTATSVATFIANEGFETEEMYTATLEGGTGTVVKNTEGVALAADQIWSFTVSATNECPCSLQDRANPAGSSTFDEVSGVELGTKLTPLANGYITKLRFYKPIISPDSTHTVHIWSSTGSSLGTATTSGESDYGWQEVKLPTPVAVTKGQVYIISYSTPSGVYVASTNYHSTNKTNAYLISYATGSPQNAATGSGNNNGVFGSTQGSYPNTGSTNGSYYWIDAVFSTTSTPPDPLEVKGTQPVADAYGVSRILPMKAAFARALNASTVTNSNVKLFDSSNVQVAGTASYESSSHSVVFTPTNPLAYNGRYTMKLGTGVEDANGMALSDEYSWSFTVGGLLLSDLNQGPGGPILVVTTSGDKYGKYYAEILRAEGLNYFEVKDIGSVTASVLDTFDAVVLAEMPLTQGQVDMFSDWVTSDGGNLVAMRPDKKLAGLLGLTDAGTTRANQYMKVDTTVAPGQGIVGDSVQFKGTADNYTVSGATQVAELYSNASTAAGNPAVSVRSVGSNGGTAATFTFDLAKSVIALHQGRQSWAGDDRDGDTIIRTNDMFFGAKTGDVQPDWVDLNKIHIPQADEQQRLLANVLTEAAKDRKPLPRFWYLPNEYKAAMVIAGDDHGQNDDTGTQKVFNNWLNESVTDCDLAAWECVRGSDYNYTSSALTQARGLQYHNLGFEVANHPPDNGGGCNAYTSYADLTTRTNTAYTTWRAKYTGIPNQRSTRYHCYVWSDYDSVIRVDVDNGVRYDLDYVTYPASWVGTRAAIITGSGMNMRFTDADGDLMDVYQGVTNFENTVTGSAAINTVLANATGATGYYGIYGTHYDMSDSYHVTLYDAAKAHDTALISADQAVTWLDGRGSSSFKNFAGANGQFTFTIQDGIGSQGLRAMMPIADAAGTLSSITRAGASVGYQTQAVKGVQYAVFDGQPGDYTITYSDYNPNAGSSSGSSSSDGSSGGSTTKPKSSKKKIASSQGTDENQTTEESVTVLPPAETPEDETEQPSNQGPDKDKKTDKGTSLTAWLIGIGLVAVILGAIWFLASRRKKQVTW